MAFIEMTCNCTASFQYETTNELRLDILSEAFRAAHRECNYMGTSYINNEQEKLQRYDVTYKEPKEKEL